MGNVLFYRMITALLAGVATTSLSSTPFNLASTSLAITYPHLGLLALLATTSLSCAVVVKRSARSVYVAAALCCLAFGIGMVRTLSVPSEMPAEFVPLIETKIELEGVIVSQPDVRETSARLRVEVALPESEGADGDSGNAVRMNIIASAPPHAEYFVGDRVRVSGKLTEPEAFATDGGRTFAYDKFLAKDGVFGIVQPAYVEVIGRETSPMLTLMRPLQAMREGFMRALGRALPEPESALAAGLIVGGKQGLGEALLDVFTIAGLLHIVVLSGYNVMIVAEGILKSLSALPKRYAFGLAALSISLFVLAAGAGPPSIRAGLMALLALLARATGRTYAVMRALFVSLVLMVLASPLTLMHDPGLQFSFIATLGLIVGAPIVTGWFVWIRNEFFRDIISSTVAAQIAVLPILLYQTGNLSLISFVANVFVLPAIPIAMASSTIAAAVALIPGTLMETIALGVGLPAYALLAYIIKVAEFSARVPLAMLVIPKFPFWVVVVTYAAFAVFVVRWNRKAKRRRVSALR
jgi:competence protein ComEC